MLSFKKNQKKLHAIDFFCGGGGMTHGFLAAGIKVLAGIDIDSECRDTYEYNNPGSKFINADLTKLEFEELSKITQIEKNDDRLVFIGCSPCQYWSIINTDKKKSAKTKNLIKYFEGFVDFYRPGYVVIENVPGIANKNRRHESLLPQFIEFLENLQYRVDYDVVKVSEYGVPQKRKRFILIASRVISNIQIPEPDKNYIPTVKDYIGTRNGFKKISAGNEDKTDFQHSTAKLSPKNLRRIQLTPKNGGTSSSWPLELMNKSQIEHNGSFVDVYGRMKWEEPGPTITTRFTSLSNGRFGHPEEDRAISLREGATLQTFPLTYVFKSRNLATNARLIGNAVPPKFAQKIASSLINQNMIHGRR